MTTDPLSTSTGMGQGEAQVFKPFQTDYYRNLGAAASRKRAKEKLPDLGDLNKIDIFYRDQPMFAESAKKIYDFTSSNADKIMSGDPTTIMELQKMKTEYLNNAALSKNVREQYETAAQSLIQKQDKLTPESIDYLASFDEPSSMGQWAFDTTKIKMKPEATPWLEHFVSKVKPSVYKNVRESGTKEDGTTTKEYQRAREDDNRKQAEQWVDGSEDAQAIIQYFNGDRQKAVDYLTENLNSRAAKEDKLTLQFPGGNGSGSGNNFEGARSNEKLFIGTGDNRKEIASEKSWYVKGSPSTTVSMSSDVIMLDKNAPADERGERRLAMGSLKVVPVVVTPEGQQIIASDDELKRIKENNPRASENIKYVPYIFGTTTGMDELDEKTARDAAIPASKIEGAVRSTKFDLDAANQLASQMNSKITKNTQQQNKPIEDPTEDQYNQLKPGDKFIYNGKEYTKQ